MFYVGASQVTTGLLGRKSCCDNRERIGILYDIPSVAYVYTHWVRLPLLQYHRMEILAGVSVWRSSVVTVLRAFLCRAFMSTFSPSRRVRPSSVCSSVNIFMLNSFKASRQSACIALLDALMPSPNSAAQCVVKSHGYRYIFQASTPSYKW